MKKLHLDKNNNIKVLIYLFTFFILISILTSFLYRGKVLDYYARFYDKFFIKDDQVNILKQENEILKNDIQNFKNIILEKNISDTEISSGLIDKIIAKKISHSIFQKDIVYSEILLNKGMISDIETGDRVYMSGFKPIGMITEVNENSSRLKLYSYNNFENEYIIKLNTNNLEKKSEQDNMANATSTLDESTSTVKSLGSDKNYSFPGVGDGSYGIKIKIPANLSVNILDKVYVTDDATNPVGEVAGIEDIISQKEKEIYIKTYYNSSTQTYFYITR